MVSTNTKQQWTILETNFKDINTFIGGLRKLTLAASFVDGQNLPRLRLDTEAAFQTEYKHWVSRGIFLSLSRFLWAWTHAKLGSHLQQLGLDANHGSILRACGSVLLNQWRVLSRNFTQLSLSSKTQCHVNWAVTEGPALPGCCLIMGDGFHADLGVILVHVILAHPSIVYHQCCHRVNLKHVTCVCVASHLPPA